MSFKPFKFEYVPPPTVPSQVVSNPFPQPEDLVLGDQERNTNAGRIIVKLDEMIDASRYLQNVIVDRFKNAGVEMGLEADPEIGLALGRLYGAEPPPTAVTIPMLNHLLDAEMAATALEMQLDEDASVQTNPIQVADLSLVTARVEKHLIESGQFEYQLPVLLRSLKADVLVFSNWKQSLYQYPVMGHARSPHQIIMENLRRPGPVGGVIRGSAMDLNRGLFSFLDRYLDRFAGVYSSVYQVMTRINHIERGVRDVIETMVLTPIADVTRIVGLFQGLKGLFHKDALQGIADSIGSFVFARMAAEVGQMTFLLDRFVNMAVSPLKSTVGRIGRLINTANRTASSVGRAVEGLKGMSKANSCGKRLPHNRTSGRYDHKQVDIPGLGAGDALPEALQSLGEHLSWATGESGRRRRVVTDSFRKLCERRLLEQRNRLDIMCSLQALDSMIGIARGFVDESQRGTNFSLANPTQRIEAVGRILTSLDTGSGATFTLEGGEVIVTPPDIPEPSPSVEDVLRRGGLERISKDDVLRIQGVVL